jgi:hypothetical protein
MDGNGGEVQFLRTICSKHGQTSAIFWMGKLGKLVELVDLAGKAKSIN